MDRKEIIKKWEASGILSGLTGAIKCEKLIAFYTPIMQQIIKA